MDQYRFNTPLEPVLARAGLNYRLWQGKVGQSHQVRYYLRRTSDKAFIAFFCQYTVKRRDETTVVQQTVESTRTSLTATEEKAVTAWLAHLSRTYPAST